MLRVAVPGKVPVPENHLNSLQPDFLHLLDLMYRCCWHPSTSVPQTDKFLFIRCATELREAGIKFKLFKDANSMFDIKFENGTLHIPEFHIDDYTERFLRNLIAYEQMFKENSDVMHATDYTTFMDYLIDSPRDVEILCKKEIIVNMLGDDKAVKTMINGLGAFVILPDNSYYTEVFAKVNSHCKRRWNKRMANLKHNYFNSPWALISVLAAALLLLLTFLQTVFSAI